MLSFIRVVLNGWFILGVYGLLLPWMISASDDFLVIGGIVVGVLIAPAVLYYANKQFISDIMENFK